MSVDSARRRPACAGLSRGGTRDGVDPGCEVRAGLMTGAEADGTGPGGGIDGGGARDDLFEDALKIVCDMGRASTSVLQRRLRVGYGRAAAILDQMEQAGFVGPPDGSRPRPVLAAAFEFYERNNQIREERDEE